MIEISVWKILVVLLVALIVLGPEHLPHAAQKLGRLVRQLKGVVGTVQKEFQQLTSETKQEDKE